MAASFWVADCYEVFGIFACFLPFLTHPHIGVASCVLFRLTEASKLADMCLMLCCIQVLRFLASLRKLYITCARCLSTYLLLGCCPRVRRGSRKTALGLLYNWVREWQRRLAEVRTTTTIAILVVPAFYCYAVIVAGCGNLCFDCLQITQLAWVIYCTC